MFTFDAGQLDRQITFLAQATVRDPTYNTTTGIWQPVATVWAEVQDMLPSRAERIAEGIQIAARPCRIRIRYRSDITAAMRIAYAGRTLQIVAGPAELGRRVGLELIAEEVSTLGETP